MITHNRDRRVRAVTFLLGFVIAGVIAPELIFKKIKIMHEEKHRFNKKPIKKYYSLEETYLRFQDGFLSHPEVPDGKTFLQYFTGVFQDYAFRWNRFFLCNFLAYRGYFGDWRHGKVDDFSRRQFYIDIYDDACSCWCHFRQLLDFRCVTYSVWCFVPHWASVKRVCYDCSVVSVFIRDSLSIFSSQSQTKGSPVLAWCRV